MPPQGKLIGLTSTLLVNFQKGLHNKNKVYDNILYPTKLYSSIKAMDKHYLAAKTVETVSDFTFGAPKSLQRMTAAMKLNDAYSLEENL